MAVTVDKLLLGLFKNSRRHLMTNFMTRALTIFRRFVAALFVALLAVASFGAPFGAEWNLPAAWLLL